MKRSHFKMGVSLIVIGSLTLSSLACGIEGNGRKPIDNFGGDWKECVRYYLEKGWAGDANNARLWCQTGNNGLERK
jgi:hypothetical protein